MAKDFPAPALSEQKWSSLSALQNLSLLVSLLPKKSKMKGENMKKSYLLMVLIMVSLFGVGAVFGQDDIKKFPSCKFCGMDREKFAHSRMLIEYDDGTAEGTCSLHCAAIDLILKIDKAPKAIRVGDYGTKSLIDAEKAFWVIGGSKMGVMTKRAKWAFEKKGDAEKFLTENGGKLASFDEAIKAAYDDIYEDTKIIRERRKTMKMQKH
jgi:copper chaperone NosL